MALEKYALGYAGVCFSQFLCVLSALEQLLFSLNRNPKILLSYKSYRPHLYTL